MRKVLKNFTLLYAEDEPQVQNEMVEYFGSYFKEVYLANDGNEAIEFYRKYKPDVMIVDIYMPHLNGLELSALVRKNDFNTKIIVISAYSQTELMLKAINTNINHYIIKPANLETIKEMLDKLSSELIRDKKEIIRFDTNSYYDNISKKLFCSSASEDEIILSYKESKLLELLVKNIGKAVSIEDIIIFVWDDDYGLNISSESVKSQVSYLRKKLPNGLITNVYGVGYMLKI